MCRTIGKKVLFRAVNGSMQVHCSGCYLNTSGTVRHNKENVKAQIGGSLSPSTQHKNGIKEDLKGRGEGNGYR